MGDFKIFFFDCSYVLNRQQLTHWAPRELFPKKKNILLCTVKMMREPGNFPYFSWFFDEVAECNSTNHRQSWFF